MSGGSGLRRSAPICGGQLENIQYYVRRAAVIPAGAENGLTIWLSFRTKKTRKMQVDRPDDGPAQQHNRRS